MVATCRGETAEVANSSQSKDFRVETKVVTSDVLKLLREVYRQSSCHPKKPADSTECRALALCIDCAFFGARAAAFAICTGQH